MGNMHFSFTASQNVAMLCQDFFNRTGINCFAYSRVYPDGSRAELWSSPDALHHTFIDKKYIIGSYTPAYYAENERYAYLENKIDLFPDIARDRYLAQIRDQKEYFDHAYPFIIVNKKDEFCEYAIFYGSIQKKSIVGFYINNLDLLENFLAFFKSAASSLIKQVSADRLVRPLAAEIKINNYPVHDFSNNANNLAQIATLSLTQRQAEIAQYVIAG
jgi:LuxR family quorum-sensing system transcriptional regulator SolR